MWEELLKIRIIFWKAPEVLNRFPLQLLKKHDLLDCITSLWQYARSAWLPFFINFILGSLKKLTVSAVVPSEPSSAMINSKLTPTRFIIPSINSFICFSSLWAQIDTTSSGIFVLVDNDKKSHLPGRIRLFYHTSRPNLHHLCHRFQT